MYILDFFILLCFNFRNYFPKGAFINFQARKLSLIEARDELLFF